MPVTRVVHYLTHTTALLLDAITSTRIRPYMRVRTGAPLTYLDGWYETRTQKRWEFG